MKTQKSTQSLFHAGDILPSEKLKRDKEVFGFSSLHFAKGWKKKHNKKHIYKFMSDKYKLDTKTYSRKVDDKNINSDNEYVCYNVLNEIKIE
jgi:hypothetical protein